MKGLIQVPDKAYFEMKKKQAEGERDAQVKMRVRQRELPRK